MTGAFPEIVFKYRDYSNEYNKKTLFDFELFLSSVSNFNDPYEGEIPFVYEPEDLIPENIFLKLREMAIQLHPDWTEKQIQQFCYDGQQKDLLNDEAHVERENAKHRDLIDKTYGILSLATNPMNYLMWSHYAKSHKGFCIGFDTEILNKTIKGSFGPVDYQDNIPKLRLFEDIIEFFVKQFSTKSKIWEYENEYRLVKHSAANKTYKYSKEMIKQIYLGCKLSFKAKNEIINFAKDHSLKCEIYDLDRDKEVFKLNSTRVY
jgi:hypothetical protein